MVFYKAVLRGSCQTQSIINVLFYGNDAGDPFPSWDANVAADLGDLINEEFAGVWTPLLPDSYSLVDVVVSGVDERGNVVSDYEVVTPINSPGEVAELPRGADAYAVLAFQTAKHFDAGRTVKRSYVAYGPLVPSQIGATGVLTAGFATQVVPVLTLLQTTLMGGLGDYRPVRLARTVAPDPTGYAVVVNTTLRPYKSNRKSRRYRPTGT